MSPKEINYCFADWRKGNCQIRPTLIKKNNQKKRDVSRGTKKTYEHHNKKKQQNYKVANPIKSKLVGKKQKTTCQQNSNNSLAEGNKSYNYHC